MPSREIINIQVSLLLGIVYIGEPISDEESTILQAGQAGNQV